MDYTLYYYLYTRLNVFGGVGANIVMNGQKLDPGADWISAAPDGSYGWCSDHLEFDLNSSEYNSILVTNI